MTGYNLPHLLWLSREQLDKLANQLPKGLTYRMYGGEETINFRITPDIIEWLQEVEGRVLLVYKMQSPDNFEYNRQQLIANSIPIKGICHENERYFFPAPTIFKFRDWLLWMFNKAQYYRDLAQEHLIDLAVDMANTHYPVYVSLPAKVNQNPGYMAYAARFLDSDLDFTIDLHVYGDQLEQLQANLEWYERNSQGRRISCLEFNGLSNLREFSIWKNTSYHAVKHQQLLNLLNQHTDEILYFTLVANDRTQHWRNPSYLHKYEVREFCINTIFNVWD